MPDHPRRSFRKLPARYATLIQPMILAAIMTFVVSGIATARALGVSPGFVSNWMTSWGISWLVAFPTMILALPPVRRLVGKIVEMPPK